MKPRTFFGFALLLPYVFWVVSMLVTFVLSAQNAAEAWNFILVPFAFYAVGVFVWFIPYTVLAIGMWIWSRKKTISALFKAGIAAPMIFFVLMLLEAVLIIPLAESPGRFLHELVNQAVFLGILSLVYGYFCVGVALGVFKILQLRNVILQEPPPPTV
jgi:hypothetical protein